MMTAKEISVGVAMLVVLAELDVTFTLKVENKNGAKGFSPWTTWFCFTPNWLNKNSVKHSCALWLIACSDPLFYFLWALYQMDL